MAVALSGMLRQQKVERIRQPSLEESTADHLDMPKPALDRRFSGRPQNPLDEAAGQDHENDPERDGNHAEGAATLLADDVSERYPKVDPERTQPPMQKFCSHPQTVPYRAQVDDIIITRIASPGSMLWPGELSPSVDQIKPSDT